MPTTQTSNAGRPAVSVIMPTYNRAYVLRRAIDSVFAQDFRDWELVVVDNGSTDETQALLAGIRDARLVVAKHPVNREVSAAMNTALDKLRGEWVTRLDSDDEMVPEALSTMLRVPKEVDPRIDAITCNCLDTTTGQFSGRGLDHDQWLDWESAAAKCAGEHWGLTKHALFDGLRFNERLRGGEAVVWRQIDRRAKRYYIHKALRIYHTEGDDRMCKRAHGLSLDGFLRKWSAHFTALEGEEEYLDTLRRFQPREYSRNMQGVVLIHLLEGRTDSARRAYLRASKALPRREKVALRAALAAGPALARLAFKWVLKWR